MTSTSPAMIAGLEVVELALERRRGPSTRSRGTARGRRPRSRACRRTGWCRSRRCRRRGRPRTVPTSMPLRIEVSRRSATDGSVSVTVGVDTDERDLTAGVADGRGGPLVDRATDGQEHVDVLVDEALRGLAAVSLASKPPVKRPSVPSQPRTLTSVPFSVVVVVDALLEAVHEDRDRREVHAAEGADDAGLRVVGRRVAGEERGLSGVEEDRLDVRRRRSCRRSRCRPRRRSMTNSMSGLAAADSTGGRREREADGDDEVAALVDEVRDVRRVVGLGVGLDGRSARRRARRPPWSGPRSRAG